MTYQDPSAGLPQSVPTNSLAIVSLVAGLIGLTIFPLLGSIVAVITGPIAKREIAESGGALGGDGLATAGMILGWVGVGLGVLGFCFICAIFVLPLLAIPIFGIEEFGFILPGLF